MDLWGGCQIQETSDVFQSLLGVLFGDPASPTLWNLYLSDFALAVDADDLCLGAVFISHLEHADDVFIVSTSAAGLQWHLNALFNWCNDNFMSVNALKLAVIIFGPLPSFVPVFWLGKSPVKVVQEHTYVGVTFCSMHQNILSTHYKNKATAVHQCGHAIIAVESLISSLPPKEGQILYSACVDPHLISGCEVVLDVDLSSLKLLCDVQHKFLHRLLGVNASSPLAQLFTELGIIPLHF
jgi:hypothetical protein